MDFLVIWWMPGIFLWSGDGQLRRKKTPVWWGLLLSFTEAEKLLTSCLNLGGNSHLIPELAVAKASHAMGFVLICSSIKSCRGWVRKGSNHSLFLDSSRSFPAPGTGRALQGKPCRSFKSVITAFEPATPCEGLLSSGREGGSGALVCSCSNRIPNTQIRAPSRKVDADCNAEDACSGIRGERNDSWISVESRQQIWQG